MRGVRGGLAGCGSRSDIGVVLDLGFLVVVLFVVGGLMVVGLATLNSGSFWIL